jgi:hypothetical protein
MTAIIILNIVFIAFVVVGILALLGWGIASDRTFVASLSGARRTAPAPRLRRLARRHGARLSTRIA